MAFEREWVFNISTESFIRSVSNPASINPPSLVYGDTPTLLVTFVKNGATPGTVEVITSATAVRVAVGTLGSAATTATATGPDANGAYTVVLPMGVAGILTILGTAAEANTNIEFKLGSPVTSYQSKVKVKALLDAGTVDPTPPPDVSLGTAAAKGMFILKDQSTDANPTQLIVRANDGTTLIVLTFDPSGQILTEVLS